MRRAVDRITPTHRGTVLVPFQDLRGSYVVIELTAANWRQIVGDVNAAFSIIRHRRELAEDIADIDKWEALT